MDTERYVYYGYEIVVYGLLFESGVRHGEGLELGCLCPVVVHNDYVVLDTQHIYWYYYITLILVYHSAEWGSRSSEF
jgi:hypothetical protein